MLRFPFAEFLCQKKNIEHLWERFFFSHLKHLVEHCIKYFSSNCLGNLLCKVHPFEYMLHSFSLQKLMVHKYFY